ncbi:DUF982 domain-containing protein [Defluviimonas sp. WL0024]|uniref:DUF982 domain-containing protein n=1 Tax=Albidovulum salinarum TaxID=2984153 RepID=A0ABT2X1J6_9RHOB|nr:DUF982 domain-containing protein [Defluviimonas sp. WL0024]MCU9847812.1 DUF982 domain-containing protein [Defluviimonas sp. WL0024]
MALSRSRIFYLNRYLRRGAFSLWKKKILIEINWGKPLTFVVTAEGDAQKFSTIEQASYWLQNKWPISDDARHRALDQLDAAMHRLATVGSARRAFILAAKTAGFVPETLVA